MRMSLTIFPHSEGPRLLPAGDSLQLRPCLGPQQEQPDVNTMLKREYCTKVYKRNTHEHSVDLPTD